MSRWHAYTALSMTVVFWGASFIATKIIAQTLTPSTIIVIRFGIGLALLLIVVAIQSRGKIVRPRNLLLLALLGFLSVPFHQWLQVTGLKTAQATVGSWIIATIPIFVAFFGWMILAEPMGKSRVLGVALAACGALAVVGKGDPIEIFLGHEGTIGDVYFLLSAINWAVFTVLSRRVLRADNEMAKDGASPKPEGAQHPLSSMTVVMGFGWLISLLWFIVEGDFSGLAKISGDTLWALLFLGVACSGLAYILWYQALSQVEATQAGMFLYLEPIVTALLAWPILGERMSLGALTGGMAILVGVWIVNRK
jgi:drug/metabolite transporter (DMT)-like permease